MNCSEELKRVGKEVGNIKHALTELLQDPPKEDFFEQWSRKYWERTDRTGTAIGVCERYTEILDDITERITKLESEKQA